MIALVLLMHAWHRPRDPSLDIRFSLPLRGSQERLLRFPLNLTSSAAETIHLAFA